MYFSFSGAKVDHSTTTANDDKVNCALGCTVRAKSEGKDRLGIATYIVNEFDKKYGESWHCIVGTGYTCRHESDWGSKIKFTLGVDEVYLFKHDAASEPKPRYFTFLLVSNIVVECHKTTDFL